MSGRPHTPPPRTNPRGEPRAPSASPVARDSQRARISAVIMTLNEERKLPGLLARLDWVDEVVIVDGGSRDATAQIARSWGAKVCVREMDSFARQRNHGLALASGDWILSIDADERPSAGFAEQVLELVASNRFQAYRVPIRSSILGRRFRFAGTQDDCPVRLARRDVVAWRGDVHEVLHVEGRVGKCSRWLDHETLPDLESLLAKINRYTTLAAQARVREGRRPRWSDLWWQPAREILRRLVWKLGFLDGPQGWGFCLMSGLSEWVLAQKHRRLWNRKTLASGWDVP